MGRAAIDGGVLVDASLDSASSLAGELRDPQFVIEARWTKRLGDGGLIEPALDVTIIVSVPGVSLPEWDGPFLITIDPDPPGDAGEDVPGPRAIRVRGRALIELSQQRARFLVPIGALEGPLRWSVRVPLCMPRTCRVSIARGELSAPPGQR